MRINPKDLAAGAIFVAIGGFFVLSAWLSLPIGCPVAIGPGDFPSVLGLALIALGVAIAVAGLGKPATPFGDVSWRGVGFVTASIVFFALTVRGLGMAPALGGATVLAALSTQRNSL